MAITKIGEKLVKKQIYVENQDWLFIQEYAKSKNKTMPEMIRFIMSSNIVLIKKAENKPVDQKPYLEV